MKDKGSLPDGDPKSDELHTPGPWRAEQSNEPDVHKRPNERDDTGICVENVTWDALMVHFPWPGPENTLARHEANARLIAAAPDLLASLKEMRDVAAALFRVIDGAVECKADIIDDLHEEFEKAGIPNGFGVRADTAIAKAT